jgi:hypothetical protein
MSRSAEETSRDGGYDALKGFAFQFDATLLEIYANPTAIVEIEGDQDLSLDDYYIQVKNRSSKFYPSAISRAVAQLLEQYETDRTRRFRLYAHFGDAEVGVEKWFSLKELDAILAGRSGDFRRSVKQGFLKIFHLFFAPDYEAQFKQVLVDIKRYHGLANEAEALRFHAIIHRYLVDLVLREPAGNRLVSGSDLKREMGSARRELFNAAYLHYFGNDKYLALIKKQFAQTSVNVPNRERLVIVDVADGLDPHTAVDLTQAVAKKFYVKGNTPRPYLAFRGASREKLTDFKRALWDAGLVFADGTNFDGDTFRAEDLINPHNPRVAIKIVDDRSMSALLERVSVAEFIDFFTSDPLASQIQEARERHIFVDSPADVIAIMK